ncbi:helix-turn-helix transcriptional regulator [Mesorhizobium sp. NZP2298]|uniref:helix-turn-helix transcriptional regulator n=1 Tax=Mesorhizobium sp. NZP2298 TaxID=2483403 RepID=UPI001554D189|nr:helix-turn-helix transcriptional regulator [Mesorhizobium sp. NZP2298]QKC94542.1 helix-turn-helix transcriptional regulator [Mesorhizobium sp. NZP2298]
MLDDLTDKIYEAAFVPDLWPDVLEGINAASTSVGGAVFLFADEQPVRGRTVPLLQDLLSEFLVGDTLQFSTAVSRMCAVQPASFVDVESFLTAEEIENDPVRKRLRALGIGAHTCTAIPMPSGELAIFVFQRRLGEGNYDRSGFDVLDNLRPAMARASLVAARLGLEKARGTVAAMTAIGLPAAVLSSSGRVLTANPLLEAMSSVFLPVALGGMAIGDADANRLFQQAIVAARSEVEPPVRSIPIPAAAGRQPLILHLLPLRRAAHEIFSGADILVAATALSASSTVPSPSLLAGLFDLTPAEARLAASLSQGKILVDAAANSNITVKTARTYLERIFAKTGTGQQSQLVALLKSAELPQINMREQE